MTKLTSILLFLSASLMSVSAQVQNYRWEEEKGLSDSDYYVVSAEENGLILFRETDKYESKTKKWDFKFLNTKLEVSQEFENYFDSDHVLIGYEYSHGFFYLLFQVSSINQADWVLHKLNFFSAEIITYEIPNEIDIELSHFILSENNLVMGGRVLNKAAVVHFSLLDKKVMVLPGFYKKETVLVDMKKNVNGTFNVLFLDKEPNTSNDMLWLKVFSSNGDLLLESTTIFDKDLRVHSGTTNELKGTDLIITGNYGSRKSKLSSGFYFINVKPGKNNRVVFTELTDLKNVFRFLGEDREQRIKEKIRGSSKDKPFDYKTTVVLWKLIEQKDNYILFSEIVDPQYQTTPTRRRYNPYGHSYGSFDVTEPFADTKYFTSVHSLVNKDLMVAVKYREVAMLVFDKSGRLLFDESHVVDDVETPYLDQLSAFDYQNDEFQMIYKDKDELIYTSGNKNGNIVADSVVSISTLNPNVEIKYEESTSGKVEHWYDNNYFVWGHHRIQNSASNERSSVFYVNKVVVY